MKNGRRILALQGLKESLDYIKAHPYEDEEIQGREITRMQKEISILESRIVNPEVALQTKRKKYRGAK